MTEKPRAPKSLSPNVTVRIRERMERDRFEVVKVIGTDSDVFWIVWTDAKLSNDTALRVTGNLTESELRTEMALSGYPEAEIDSRIEQAKKNPG